jgi:uncharacterized protein
MKSMRGFIQRYAVLTYYSLTFAISWGGVLLVIGGPGGISATPEHVDRLLPAAILAMLAGPGAAGILMTGLVSGRAGYRDLLTRLLKWRVGARWYAVAILTAPLVFTVALLALSLLSREFLPGILVSGDKASLLLFGIPSALAVGIFEELGWTGFAIPRLRLRHGVFATGLIAGVLWGAWHLLTNDFWASSASSGTLPLALFVTLNGLGILVGQLTAFRVLMVWVNERTGSLLVAALMHASLTASTFVLGPLAASGAALLAYDFALAVLMWVVVAAVALAGREQRSRQPVSMPAA